MFAVPGWSVSADGLKAETEVKKPKPEGAAPNKRKRATKKKDESVTDENVANLWERVIEGKVPKPKSDSEKKRERKDKAKAKAAAGREGVQQPAQEPEKRTSKLQDEASVKPAAKKQKQKRKKTAAEEPAPEAEAAAEDEGEGKGGEDVWGGFSDDEPSTLKDDEEPPKKKAKKDKKKDKKDNKAEAASSPSAAAAEKPTPAAPAPATAPAAPAAPKLTPLQASMRAKLVSARFRHLNETLYTRPSADALQLFTDTPDMFTEYHEGFRRQVEVWPENPVDGYIRDIKARAKVRPPPRDSHRKPSKPQQQQDADAAPGAAGQLISLPRTDGTCTVADLGCGDARLAETLTPLASKLKLALHSFDLHSPHHLVTRADIANVPLADGAADVAIFCLALMGTNWLDFIEEAYRILRWKGELWIAEIKSRFAGKAALAAGAGAGARVEHSVGNRKRQQTVGKKGKPAAAAAADADAEREELAVEVDGADDRRNETDISAFVEALRKRGFVLQTEDMSNKMFVRMLFVKAAPPTKGKGVEAAKAREAAKAAALGSDRNKKQKRFVWDTQDEEDAIDESAILKPCVYKLR